MLLSEIFLKSYYLLEPCFHVVNRVLHRTEFLGVFVGDLDVILVLERHDDLNRVQRVASQVLTEKGLWNELVHVDSQHLGDDLFYALFDGVNVFCHEIVPSFIYNTLTSG